MAQDLKIVAVSPQTKSWDGKYGEMITYYVKFEGDAEATQMNKKASSEPPKVGDTVYGAVTTDQYGQKFKGEKKPFTSGGKSFSKADSTTMYVSYAKDFAIEMFKKDGEVDLARLDEIMKSIVAAGLKAKAQAEGQALEKPSLKDKWVETVQKKAETTKQNAPDYIPSDDELDDPVDLSDIPF